MAHPDIVNPASILADDRERPSGIPTILQTLPEINVTIRRLAVGDYLVANSILVERKSIPDFLNSIVSGRLFSQAGRLASAPYRSMLFLEGDDSEFQDRHLRQEAVRGTLISLATSFGLPVIRTANKRESAEILAICAKQAVRRSPNPYVRRGKRPTNARLAQIHVLLSIPGIGVAKAERLLSAFRTVRGSICAEEQDLVALPGFGPALAKRFIRICSD